MDHVEQASARVRTRPTLTIHALAGDLARNDAALREALHARGMLTGGIPTTLHPLLSRVGFWETESKGRGKTAFRGPY